MTGLETTSVRSFFSQCPCPVDRAVNRCGSPRFPAPGRRCPTRRRLRRAPHARPSQLSRRTRTTSPLRHTPNQGNSPSPSAAPPRPRVGSSGSSLPAAGSQFPREQNPPTATPAPPGSSESRAAPDSRSDRKRATSWRVERGYRRAIDPSHPHGGQPTVCPAAVQPHSALLLQLIASSRGPISSEISHEWISRHYP